MSGLFVPEEKKGKGDGRGIKEEGRTKRNKEEEEKKE